MTISVRNEGTEPTPRLFAAEYTISGRGFITGRVPISSLRPGQQVQLESTADEILQGVQRIFVFVNADTLNLIPEDINTSNNRVMVRCAPNPVVGTGPLGM